jgi:hypothetical protein
MEQSQDNNTIKLDTKPSTEKEPKENEEKLKMDETHNAEQKSGSKCEVRCFCSSLYDLGKTVVWLWAVVQFLTEQVLGSTQPPAQWILQLKWPGHEGDQPFIT